MAHFLPDSKWYLLLARGCLSHEKEWGELRPGQHNALTLSPKQVTYLITLEQLCHSITCTQF